MNTYINEIFNYMNSLADSIKDYKKNNPDLLDEEELRALEERVNEEIEKCTNVFRIQSNIKPIKSRLSDDEIAELWVDFVDWYQIVTTPSQPVLEHIKSNYPVQKYKRILCVGDGKRCHLGRKLADIGYQVISMDPVADIEIAEKRGFTSKGYFRIINQPFFHNHPILDSVDIIVGSKVPPIAEEILLSKKPSVFTISKNPEIYKMRFSGELIISEEQLIKLIKTNYPQVNLVKYRSKEKVEYIVFDNPYRNLEEKEKKTQNDKVTQNSNLEVPNLNELTEKQVQALENYVCAKMESDEITGFFKALKSGKLQNKKIDIDALDFIEDGFSSCVEEGLKYINKTTQNEEDKQEIQVSNLSGRTKNLQFKNQLSNDTAVIKDGYVYLFRVADAGSKDFHAEAFDKEKMTLREYISKNPTTDIDRLAREHFLKGKGWFVSTSSDLHVAETFAKSYEQSRVYLIRVKAEDAYKVSSPFDKLNFLPNSNGKGEREFLIPDYIDGTEIIGEYRLFEYQKILNYLRQKERLRISPTDIGLIDGSRQEEYITRYAFELRDKLELTHKNDENHDFLVDMMLEDENVVDLFAKFYNKLQTDGNGGHGDR